MISMRRLLKVGFALFITGLIFYACLSQVNIHELGVALGRAKLGWIVIGALCSFGILFVASMQLKLLLPRFGQVLYPKMFQIVAVFSMVINLVPFWGGHALLIYLLGKKEKIGKTVALSMLTMEQMAEGFGKVFLFLVVTLTMPLPIWLKKSMDVFLAAILLAYVVLLLSALFLKKSKWVEHSHRPWVSYFLKFVNKWAANLHVLRDWKKSLASFSLAASMKFLEVLAVYCVHQSFDLNFTLVQAFFVVAVLGIAIALPLTPGRVGIFEGSALLIYQYLGLPTSEALGLGLILHAVHTLPAVITGYICSLLMGVPIKQLDINSDLSVQTAY